MPDIMTEGGIRINSPSAVQPKVTIITVVFNAATLLGNFFENVTPYLSADVELVMLDGNSTDSTLELLQQHNNLITYWRSDADNGIYDAMNKAVKFARGKWLYFMGADDVLLGGFAKALNLLVSANTVYYGKVVLWGDVVGKPYKRYDFTKVEICHQSIFYPCTVFEHYQYHTPYKVSADHYLNMQCFTDKRYQWQFINQLLAIYDTRGFSAALTDHDFKSDYDQIIKRHLGLWAYIRYKFRMFKHKGKKK